MPAWQTLATGPVARFALALFVLGLLRLLLLTLWDLVQAYRRAGDRQLPLRQILLSTLGWLLPFNRLHRSRPLYSYASFGFHLGLLGATLFLRNHIDLVAVQTGLAWPALFKPLLDGLALLAIAGGLVVLLYRVYAPASRALSKPVDYLLLLVLLAIFTSGFIAGQAWNPIPYNALMLFHTVMGVLILALIPFTKIAHCVLYPLIRLGSELAWRFRPEAGSKVVKTIYGPEGRQV